MFSYEDYKEIIRIIQSTGNQAVRRGTYGR